MLKDIKKCTLQTINAELRSLDVHKDYVFWVRNNDMSKQIYVSPSYEKVWGQKVDILFTIPMVWFDYLSIENKANYMEQLQQRHIEYYLNEQKNLVFYQVITFTGETRYISDRSFRVQDNNGIQYVIGVAKSIPENLWQSQFKIYPFAKEKCSELVYQHYFKLLRESFGLRQINQMRENAENSNFTKREIECLNYIRKGMTNKQVARQMNISYRTVESHLDNIRNKTKCKNKIELVSRYSQFIITEDEYPG